MRAMRSAASLPAQVLADVKQRHATAPKYVFNELSQTKVINRYGIKVEDLSAKYVVGGSKGAHIVLHGAIVSPEAFATDHYRALGWSVLGVESVPFHALFGVMMWLLIQDPLDPQNRIVGFGDRNNYEATRQKSPIWTLLPEDFGTKGYGRRRAAAIEEHLAQLLAERESFCGRSTTGGR